MKKSQRMTDKGKCNMVCILLCIIALLVSGAQGMLEKLRETLNYKQQDKYLFPLQGKYKSKYKKSPIHNKMFS